MGYFDWLASPAGMETTSRVAPYALVADQIGQRLNPKSDFAGIPTSLAQSALAGKERAEDKALQKSWIEQLIKGMTPQGTPGLSNIKVSLDPKTGLPKYSLTGEGGLDKMFPGLAAPVTNNPFEDLGYKPIGG